MIDTLEGTLTSKSPTEATLKVGGVGFLVNVPISTFSGLPATGENVQLFTFLYVREDQLKLFGFATEAERQIFVRLLDVTRIGPSVALKVLSSCSVEEFKSLIGAGDVKQIASMVKGVGKKTAQRLVLELKGELAEVEDQEQLLANPVAGDVVKALISLGESEKNARKIVENALEKLGPDAGEEELMREVLAE
ncbi:MAG: Holliday junction branch migration protein RuvA [Planctomycetes bacterium]|nr:Holliday junction branch migration protein RuvA [Planctomycetota bacterium]